MVVYKEWLNYGLEKKGKSGKGLANYLGIQPSAVSRMLSGERRILASELDNISRYIEEPIPFVTNPYPNNEVNQMLIAGFVNKGIWFEREKQKPLYEDIPKLHVSGLEAEQYAYILTYDCHTHLKDTYLITVRPEDIKREGRDNDIVIVERTREDLSQFVLAQFSVGHGKRSIIDLDSSLDQITKIDSDDCYIAGLVIGSITRLYRSM